MKYFIKNRVTIMNKNDVILFKYVLFVFSPSLLLVIDFIKAKAVSTARAKIMALVQSVIKSK